MVRPGLQSAARRYARALLDVALQQGNADRMRAELQVAVSVIRGHRELQAALDHPAVSADRKKKMVAAIWGGGQASALTVRLLELLVERDRISLLPLIEATFATLWNQQRGVVPVEAVTSSTLAPEQEQALAAAIRRVTGKEVELTVSVDPALRGGVMLRMLGQTYDGTVRGRLKAMRRRLVQGAEGA